jgi:hypothetical protein
MSSTRRLTIPMLAAALAAASLALPGAALARGGAGGGGTGGGGGGGTTPAPVVTVPACDFSLDGIQPDGSTLFTNTVADAGCITVRASGFSLSLYSVVVWPGWTYTVISNGGGTNSRVDVSFTNPTTGEKHEARIESGKTIK